MKRRTFVKSTAIAAAMAGLISSGVSAVAYAGDTKDSGVKCSGANSCKGSGSCKSASNECKGKNGCKGTGWIHVKDEAECKAKGGSVVK